MGETIWCVTDCRTGNTKLAEMTGQAEEEVRLSLEPTSIGVGMCERYCYELLLDTCDLDHWVIASSRGCWEWLVVDHSCRHYSETVGCSHSVAIIRVQVGLRDRGNKRRLIINSCGDRDLCVAFALTALSNLRW